MLSRHGVAGRPSGGGLRGRRLPILHVIIALPLLTSAFVGLPQLVSVGPVSGLGALTIVLILRTLPAAADCPSVAISWVPRVDWRKPCLGTPGLWGDSEWATLSPVRFPRCHCWCGLGEAPRGGSRADWRMYFVDRLDLAWYGPGGLGVARFT
jgi:hypothetical protein